MNHSLSLKSESVSKISYNIVYLIIQLLNKDQFIKFKSIFNIGRKLHDILISLQCFLLHIGLIYKKTSFMIYPGNHHHFYNRNLYGQRCCQSKPAFLRSLTSWVLKNLKLVSNESWLFLELQPAFLKNWTLKSIWVLITKPKCFG